MSEPYPKTKQLARGERRYKRKVASPKQWAAFRAAKLTECRLTDFVCQGRLELHHVISRAHGGDDVADNLTPLCSYHHKCVTEGMPSPSRAFVERLTDAEYAYAIDKMGEAVFERVYRIRYER